MKQILYFSSNSCAPCVVMTPIMNILQTEMSVTFINAASQPDTAKQWGVSSVPTVLLVKNGMEIGRLVGARSKEEIRSLYNR